MQVFYFIVDLFDVDEWFVVRFNIRYLGEQSTQNL